jgi:hypothetical protein
MSNEKRDGNAPEQSDSARLLAELRAQCERLQEVVQDLQQEKKRDTEALAAMRAELTDYQRLVYDWAHRQVREEDWRDFAEAHYTIAVEDTIKELERQEGQ